jgi:hypothetical protein
MRNTLKLSLDNNPDLQETFQGRSVGDKVRVEVEATIDELTVEDVALSVDEVIPLSPPAEEKKAKKPVVEEEEDIEPSLGAAVSSTMGVGRGKMV